ncbi:hypothetical protein [Nocardia sp. NPDC058497]|uniref:hypothetical protein n=1 Tax=Nocardia sp. NPDC058497 TaxID=3346529 RepID=UPI00365C9A3B
MTGDSGGRVRLVRRIAVVLLVVATGLFTLTAVVAGYLRTEVLDTDRYVDTMAPLADDPVVQNAIADALTRTVMARIDVESAASDLLESIGDAENRGPLAAALVRSLPSMLVARSEELVRDAATVLVRSDAFPRLWNAANRQAHRGLVAALTGVDSGLVHVDTGGVVTISLDQMLDEVGDELDSRGFALADRVVDLRSEFVILDSDELAKAQRAVRLLDRAAIALEITALACAIGAVLLAGSGFRRRAILGVAASVLVAMVVLAVALMIARGVYLDHVPAQVISEDVARTVFDTLLLPLRVSMRVLAVLGALVALGAFLAGPSAPATWVRTTADRVLDRLRRGERGPVSGCVAANTGWLRYAVLIVAATVLVFWDYPTARVAVLIAVVAGVALLALEIVAGPGRVLSPDR